MCWLLQKRQTTLIMVLVWIAFALIGIGLIGLSTYLDTRENSAFRWSIFLSSIGSLFFVSAVVTSVWEFFAKRSFSSELLSLFQISTSFSESGVIQYEPEFQSSKIDWEALFHKAKKVNVLFTGNSSWRDYNFSKFENLVKDKKAHIKIILPDPENFMLMQRLQTRLRQQGISAREYVYGACDKFIDLIKRNDSQAKLEIWFSPKLPSFSVFMFDEKAVISFYSHRNAEVKVPTFICHQGKTLFSYAEEEINYITDTFGRIYYPHKLE